MFRRKKDKGEDEAVETTAEETPAPAKASGEPTARTGDEREPTTGPYDSEDVDDAPRLDLGSLRLSIPEGGVEVRVDVSPEGQVQAATVVHNGSSMQINAFAAPRREGIWVDVRTEISEALREQGGSAEEVAGPFGPELRARIPTGQPGQTQPARFLGADGPRWFVRGLITGPASTDAAQADVLLEVFRNLVVVRGKEAMAPRDQLPLRLPKEAQAAAQAAAEAEAANASGSDDFNPFERGPEITEVR